MLLPGDMDPHEFGNRLLSAVQPSLVVFSIGRGHCNVPNPQTVTMLREVLPNARIVRTQLSKHCSLSLPCLGWRRPWATACGLQTSTIVGHYGRISGRSSATMSALSVNRSILAICVFNVRMASAESRLLSMIRLRPMSVPYARMTSRSASRILG